MIVVDASAWATALADPAELGARSRAYLGEDAQWTAPSHMPTEVLRTLRRMEQAGRLTTTEATALVGDVLRREVRYIKPEPWLLESQWQLRHNLSAYDAAYVALGRRRGLPLITLDLRLAKAATALGVEVQLVQRD